MTIRQTLTAADRRTFPIGQAVRYRPGFGVYGFEDCLDADGRLPGIVLGHTDTRVQIELTLTKRRGATVRRSVNAAQLVRVDAQTIQVDDARSPTSDGGAGRDRDKESSS